MKGNITAGLVYPLKGLWLITLQMNEMQVCMVDRRTEGLIVVVQGRPCHPRVDLSQFRTTKQHCYYCVLVLPLLVLMLIYLAEGSF